MAHFGTKMLTFYRQLVYYRFEKLYAGHYLGELVRLALVRLTKLGLLFSGQATDKLLERWRFTTAHVTAVERWVLNFTTPAMLLL